MPYRLLSPQQILKQHFSIRDGFNMDKDNSAFAINSISKTIPCDLMTNLSILHTEPGLTHLYTLIQDGSPEDNLSFAQRQLLHWHRRLGYMDFKKIKDFARKGFLLKEIANC